MFTNDVSMNAVGINAHLVCQQRPKPGRVEDCPIANPLAIGLRGLRRHKVMMSGCSHNQYGIGTMLTSAIKLSKIATLRTTESIGSLPVPDWLQP
jgi:hypothetical protein